MAKTIQQLQAFIDTNPDIRQLVNEIADYLQANPGGDGGSLGYLVYTAHLTLAGEDDPTPTIMGNNTIGAIVWTRTGAGSYSGTLVGAFPTTKVLPYINNSIGDNLYFYRNSDDEMKLENDGTDINADLQLQIQVYP